MRNPVSIRGPRNPVTIRGSRNPVTLSGSKNPVTDNGSRNPVTFVTPVAFTGVDPDAASFLTRAGITDPAQQGAINELVLQLKNAGVWTSLLALYPYVGGTAAAHSHNLLSSSYQITWSGAVTHNANGITGDGSTGYGNTGLKPSDIGTNGGISVYMRSAPSGDNNAPAGVDNNADNFYGFIFNQAFNHRYGRYGNTALAQIFQAPPPGLHSINRTSSTALRLDFNGVSVATDGTTVSAPALALNFFVLAQNNNGNPFLNTEENDAMTAFHQGLTQGQSSALYTAIQAYQTSLGRQVS